MIQSNAHHKYGFTFSGVKKYKCTICKQHFRREVSLKVHIQNIHQKKKYKCHICLQNYTLKSTLQIHMNSHTKQKLFNCNFCGKQYIKREFLRFHLKAMHTTTKDFKCNMCSSSFIVKRKLTEHVQQVHVKKILYKCPTCQKSFSHKCNLLSHTRTKHTGGKHFSCPHCPLVADCKKDLDRHLEVHNQNGLYKCTDCSASFMRLANQRRHLQLVHKKEPEALKPKVFKCSKCPRNYKHRTSVQRHELTHDQIKNFKCTICVAKFDIKRTLFTHMACHNNGTGQFLCAICKADFYSQKLLSDHNRKWHWRETLLKSPTFKCTYCIAQYIAKGSFRRHLKVHRTTSNRYWCSLCKARFSFQCSLTLHNSTWHNKNVPNKTSHKVGATMEQVTNTCARASQKRKEGIHHNGYLEYGKESGMATNHMKSTQANLFDPRSFFANTFIE